MRIAILTFLVLHKSLFGNGWGSILILRRPGFGANRDSHPSLSQKVFWVTLGAVNFLKISTVYIYIYVQYIRRRLTNMPERDALPHKQILAKLRQKNIGVGGMA